ncbi:MAG: right-handed parallel beta-helix repeat-containing protein, partial [Chthonomonadaceae bacterium]|nr:right-handed parallel beta-helix repeat-containing protein [Chthonomonadaceae bacterium]
SFAFRREAGALFYHAWRTNDTPYIEGPSIRVTQDGTLTANGKKLTQLPVSRWVTIAIHCGVGKDATGTYSLRIKGEGRTPAEEFRDLPCPKLSRLSWLGFVADANADAVFYLDDISLK